MFQVQCYVLGEMRKIILTLIILEASIFTRTIVVGVGHGGKKG